MDDEVKKIPPNRSRAGLVVGGLALVGVVLGLGAIYGMGTTSGNGENACPGAAALAERLAPLARGEVAALAVAREPKRLQPVRFERPDGAATQTDAWLGRTVLLNLWATWCAPCREEMPALDTLEKTLGGDGFEVVAVNIDQRNRERAEHFLDEIGVTALTRYRDPSAKIFQELKSAGLAFGMPTTLLLDRQGCVLASIAGPADWASADAQALLRTAIAGEAKPGT
jgi:thiol-disulfide isomerase/thioredoxin